MAPADPQPQRTAPSNPAVTRDCESRVDGAQTPPKPSDVVVGPVTFQGLRAVVRQRASDFWPRRGRYLVWKSVTEVEAQEEVTLVVPQAERGRLALLYDQSRYRSDGRYRLSDGASSVRLTACPADHPSSIAGRTVGPATQFNGGFIVTGPQCARVDVYVRGEETPRRERIAFGRAAGRCGAR